MNHKKYSPQYHLPPKPAHKWVTRERITHAPRWCSVDLRDGNQSLITPMSLDEKLEFFTALVGVGFKEIEVGFPAASETEYTFLRALIERGLVPDDVTLQVLTQSREHIIAKTFEALRGAKRAVVHLYNSTSVAQREQVFKKSKAEIIEIAVSGAKLLKEFAAKERGEFRFEYSPESFTGTEPEFALEISNAVMDVWQPTLDKKAILNLPVTVEHSMSHVYADQVEYICDNLHNRENVIISLHPHNDRGCAVADCEFGLLAGADRIEGTLFGNGERTGNADIVTLAMNMYSQGVDPELDLSDMPRLVELYERVTKMSVHARSPYAGALVFAAFSGSHQDAIAKGIKWREEKDPTHWNVPYLPIDPHDVGREYETDVIRINSQSGKGGIGYLLEKQYGYDLPPKLRERVGYAVKAHSDKLHKELSKEEVLSVFEREFVNMSAPLNLERTKFGFNDETYDVTVIFTENGERKTLDGQGNGRLDAVANALRARSEIKFGNLTYNEHALTVGSTSKAVTYVGITWKDGVESYGVGVDNDIIKSSVLALFSAINRRLA